MRYINVKNYEKLAKYYDLILSDEKSLNKYWLSEFKKSAKGNKVLELACGSGLFSRILKNAGFEIVATDLEKEMIKIAQKNDNSIDYFTMNMINFDLSKEFDNIICICDSVNYLTIKELESMFLNVYKHLKVGGLFMFDMHHLKRLEEFKGGFFEEENLDDISYQWSIVSDDEHFMLFENFVFYINDEIFIEKHIQFVHKLDDVVSLLIKIGFEVEFNQEFIKDEKILIKGVKR